MLARGISVLLAFWLMVSVFLWPHGAQESMAVGLYWAWILVVMSASAFVEPRIRYGAAALGFVLAIYSLFAHHAVAFTRWHDFAVGVLFMILAVFPSAPVMRHQIRPERRITT
jgi:hypothetical protein